ncbi:MAG: four helix bundle protein [Bacteroidales bacterium]|nr:four helix bundle protein [Bacteroidales bacterium]
MRLYSFEKLDVWKLSRKLTKNIYQISAGFSDNEKFGLTSQIRRASISVSSNIAEGSSRKSGIEQARFTEIAFGSLLEILNQLIVANDLEYIKEEVLNNQRPLIEEIGNKLNKLKEAQLKRGKNN